MNFSTTVTGEVGRKPAPIAARPSPLAPLAAATFILLAVVHVILNRLAWSGVPLQTDSGIWAYMGWRMLDGAVLYRDLWDNKPPGLFLVFEFVQWLFGSGRDGSLLWMDAVVTVIVGAISYATARRFASPVAAAGAMAMLSVVLCHRVLADWGDNAEKFTAVFEIAGCLVAVRILQRGHGLRWWLFVGICGGAAATFKQTGVVMLIAATLTHAVQIAWRRQSLRHGAAAVGIMLFGAFVVWAPLVAWMHQAGSLDGFWRQAVMYDFNRASALQGEQGRLLAAEHWASVIRQLLLGFILFAPAFLGAVQVALRFLPRGNPNERESVSATHHPSQGPALMLVVLYAALAGAIFVAAPSGYGHYLLQAAPPAAVLAAWSLSGAGAIGPKRRFPLAACCLLALGLRPLGDHLRFTLDPGCAAREAYRAIARRTAGLVEAAREHSRPEQEVMIWPTDHAVSYYAQRVTPLEVGHSIDIFRGRIQLLDPPLPELLAHVRQNPPALIVDWSDLAWMREPGTDEPDALFPAVREAWSLVDPPDDVHAIADARRLAPFKRWVRENYGGQVRIGDVCTLYFHGRSWREWEDYLRPGE